MYTARKPAYPSENPRILRAGGRERGLTIVPKGMEVTAEPVIGQTQSAIIWLLATGRTMVIEWGNGEPMLHVVET